MNIELHGLGSTPLGHTCGIVQVSLSPLSLSEDIFELPMHVTDSICAPIPSYQLFTNLESILTTDEIQSLADPTFFIPSTVDILLGVDFIARYLSELSSGEFTQFSSIQTALGKLIYGPCESPERTLTSLMTTTSKCNIPPKKPRKKKRSQVSVGEVLTDITQMQWKLGPSLGKGSFGDIYCASRISPNQPDSFKFAIKIEPLTNGPLFVEIHFLIRHAKPTDLEGWIKSKSLSTFGMPRYISSGSHCTPSQSHRFLVMDRFDRDLWSVFRDFGNALSIPTVLRLGAQLLEVLEYIHSRGYVHNDIKGENILLSGALDSCSQIYLVDFGLVDMFTTQEYKPNPKKAHNGTIMYMSRDAHHGVPTRRGDLETLAYNLLQWLGNKLPWESATLSAEEVLQAKSNFFLNPTQVQEFRNVPDSLVDLFQYLGTMTYISQPSYSEIQSLLLQGLKDVPTDPIFSTSITSKDSKNKTADLPPPPCPDNNQLENLIKGFWEIEAISTIPNLHPLEQLAEDAFKASTTRQADGRYIVRLPFNPTVDSAQYLSPTFNMAIAAFKNLEVRFTRDPQFHSKYAEFIRDYLESGHMTRLSRTDSLQVQVKPHFFIPHHGVIKKNDPSLPLRVVFNASAKTKSTMSLNDCLLPGPKLQSDLVKLVLDFRMHKYIIATDIRQMFRQIVIAPEDRPFQLIVWRNQPSHPIQTFQLNTVTYGMTSSPYLAIRTLHQLVHDEGHAHPSASKILLNNTFVDDILFGSDSIPELLNLRQDIIDLLSKGQFTLKKWKANYPDLLDNLPADHLETIFDPEALDEGTTKLLGIKWCHRSDEFRYNFTPMIEVQSKRQLLSQIARLYDPIGWLSPIIIKAKILMQAVCHSSPSWDDPLPHHIKSRWGEFCSDLTHVHELSIPRHARLVNSTKYVLHSFGDASNHAYGAVVYLVAYDKHQNSSSHLLISKSRVAPLKTQSIPRLELCAALLSAELLQYTESVLDGFSPNVESHLWTDSTIVLAWIRRQPCTLATFVANRVSKIQSISTTNWHHVPSQQNPADLASRGTTTMTLKDSSLWWHGPDFLQLPQSRWPSCQSDPIPDSSLPDLKKIALLVNPTPLEPSFVDTILARFSDFLTLQRVVAYILRFSNNSRQGVSKRFGPLSLSELRLALKKLIWWVQQQAFPADLVLISKDLLPSARLRKLKPFIHSDGLLHVGGRISRSELPDLAMHPYILPSNSPLTHLLILHYHTLHLHVGYQTLHNILAQQYWILSPRRTIKSSTRSCLSCFRTKPAHFTPPMADLPPFRVRQIRPFAKTGLDFAGPFTTRPRKVRDKTRFKSYLCVFVCMATKAIHLELLTDMTRDCFIVCLDRFVARRGCPLELFSDQGTTFIAANKFLKAGFRSLFSSDSLTQLSQHLQQSGIRWSFNPPGAPHFGGLWETAVKSAKTLLYRSIGQQCLTHEQLETLFVRIEASLNSRPLTALSTDPSDLLPLTPGHFLVGTPLITLPRPANPATGLTLHSRWKLLDNIFLSYWNQWHKSYLHTLQQRAKWHKSLPEIQIGDLVLIKSENYPPLSWPLARVQKLVADSKGVIRSATVNTAQGTYDRPLVKLCPLPLSP